MQTNLMQGDQRRANARRTNKQRRATAVLRLAVNVALVVILALAAYLITYTASKAQQVLENISRFLMNSSIIVMTNMFGWHMSAD